MDLSKLKNSAQFVVDAEGNRVAVQIDPATWDTVLALVEAIESNEGLARSEALARVQLELFTDFELEVPFPENDGLSLLTQVYEGLSPEEIDEVEQIALDRSHFFSDREG
jgi:hypothetical protein